MCTIGYAPDAVGGAEQQARMQARELRRRGHSVEVVTQRRSGATIEADDGIRVHRLRSIGSGSARLITYLPRLVLFLLMNARRFDVIHVHLANLQADAVGVAARVTGTPVYVKVAMGGPRGEIARMRRVAWATRYVGIRSAHRVQSISMEIERDLKSIGIADDRIVRIPNGVDTDLYHPVTPEAREAIRRRLDLPSDGPLVLFVGRFARYKGILDLLAAWETVAPETTATLVLVGEPALDAPLGPLPAAARTIVRAWTPAIADYYNACDVYVHPSHADGMPNVVLEAMACGLAVVATRVAAVPEMIEDGLTGLLCDVGDRDELARSLRRLIDDPVIRERMGVAAVERIRTRYRIERVVDEIEAAYQAIRRLDSRRGIA